MITLRQTAQGIVLTVKAEPGARMNAIRGEHNGSLKAAVTQVAEKGKANLAIIELLSKSLCLRKSQIHLVSGETNATKQFLITDCDSKFIVGQLARYQIVAEVESVIR